MSAKVAVNAAKLIITDLILDVFYWPIWWYTKGLYHTLMFCFDEIKEQEENLGLSIWVKNLFTPMYGQYDIEGRIISFFIRLVQIIFRLFMLLSWAIMVFFLLIVWIALPPAIIYEIIFNLL